MESRPPGPRHAPDGMARWPAGFMQGGCAPQMRARIRELCPLKRPPRFRGVSTDSCSRHSTRASSQHGARCAAGTCRAIVLGGQTSGALRRPGTCRALRSLSLPTCLPSSSPTLSSASPVPPESVDSRRENGVPLPRSLFFPQRILERGNAAAPSWPAMQFTPYASEALARPTNSQGRYVGGPGQPARFPSRTLAYRTHSSTPVPGQTPTCLEFAAAHSI